MPSQPVAFTRLDQHCLSERRTSVEQEDVVKVLDEYFEIEPEFPEAEQVAVWKYLSHL